MDNDNNNNNDINDNHTSGSTSTDGVDAPASVTPSSCISSRKSPYLGFTDNSMQDEHLVKALTINNPFKAGHGEKGATWERVLKHLQTIDEVATVHGQATLFEGVTTKACKARWDALFAKHQKRFDTVLNSIGTIPIETQHDQRIDNLYNDQVEHGKTKSASKDANIKKRKRQQENRAMGATIQSASLDMACYRSSSSLTEDESNNSSSSSMSQPTRPLSSLSNPTTKIRIESDYKRRKRTVEDIAKMRAKLIEDDVQRRKEVEFKRQQQHDALTKMIEEGNHNIVNTIRTSYEELIKSLKENIASQKQGFDMLATLLQRLLEK
ncbi:hypothetical protein BGZ97_012042 [Linnemannia gamsii]|uniref:Myb-like domain-containing protein n=1 Tax=Linnemannia gamsii TaxID=64522 RepID=A0A9P6RIN9_9FUNG|nr:hypothetical protein BGZ97_012042 [Linnemannia gamsii]